MSTYYICEDTDLTSVADAIRTKGGTSASLTFPAGFVQAIGAIPSGSGGTEITTAGDYTINAGDTITMGTGLTGALTASAQRALTNSWDFKTGLVDSVGGLTATLGNNATQNSSGVTIDASSEYVQIPVKLEANHSYEFDIASISKTFSSGHGRILMWSSGDGFIAQNGNQLKIYTNSMWSANGGSNISDLAEKTVRVDVYPYPLLINGSTVDYLRFKLYLDGTLWYEPEGVEKASIPYGSYVRLGQDSASFATMVITGFRAYSGTNV